MRLDATRLMFLFLLALAAFVKLCAYAESCRKEAEEAREWAATVEEEAAMWMEKLAAGARSEGRME